ncbi:MAG: PDDEXK nuclease domain-containing protein [Candidatus Aminicenantales bacterium]
MKRESGISRLTLPMYERIRQILDSARSTAARSVNTTQVVANWLIGREIVEEEQKGKRRAEYGKKLIESLAASIAKDYGAGYSVQSLFYMKQFYLSYPELCSGAPILQAVRGESSRGLSSRKLHAVRGEWSDTVSMPLAVIPHAVSAKSWKPGGLHPNLSWTHYRTLLRVDKAEARAFYEIEAIKNNWAARELERQINSLLYERLALSRDKKGLMRLAVRGHEVQKPTDVFKDPVIMEFLGLPESPRLVETELEQALIDNLQIFLLELGKGFAFVARQERLTLDGDHFYIDLVFYHTILKCYVIIDLKTGKLTHQDLGQLQLYVNYYDRERRTEGDGPTLGLILCADKNDAVVRYTLGADQRKTIFASRYKLHLPSVAELRAELRREVRALSAPIKMGGAK